MCQSLTVFVRANAFATPSKKKGQRKIVGPLGQEHS